MMFDEIIYLQHKEKTLLDITISNMAPSLLSSLYPSLHAFLFVTWALETPVRDQSTVGGSSWPQIEGLPSGERREIENGNCDSTRPSETKKTLYRIVPYTLISLSKMPERRFWIDKGHEFYKNWRQAKWSKFILTLRKSPTYWTGSKSIFWLMMKTIIVHTKYVSFTTRPLHLINPHICVWVTLYVKHKRFLCSWFLVSSDFSAGFFALLRYWQNTCNRSTYLSVGAQGKISGSLRFLHLASAYNTEENQMLYV